MNGTKDGGTAFPIASDVIDHCGGMSLRDWFAGQALAGILANCDKHGANGWLGIENLAAEMAFNAADAMLAAREGGAA